MGLGAGPPGLGALFAGGTPKLRPVGSASAERSPGESVLCMFVPAFFYAFSSFHFYLVLLTTRVYLQMLNSMCIVIII